MCCLGYRIFNNILAMNRVMLLGFGVVIIKSPQGLMTLDTAPIQLCLSKPGRCSRTSEQMAKSKISERRGNFAPSQTTKFKDVLSILLADFSAFETAFEDISIPIISAPWNHLLIFRVKRPTPHPISKI